MAGRTCTLILLIGLANASNFIEEAVNVIKLSQEIGEEVLTTWETLETYSNGSGVAVLANVVNQVLSRNENLVLSRLDRITEKIHRLERSMEQTSAVAMLLARSARRGTKLELRLHEIADLLSRVAASDRVMREYVRLQSELEPSTLEDFAQWCVTHDPSALPGLLERIHSLIAPPHQLLLGRGILDLVLDDLKDDHPDLCELQLSPHQLIYDMYNTISLTEIKGYAMMQFSWMLLRVYGRGNFTFEARLARERYEERTSRTADAARAALMLAKRDLYACDPAKHVLGETYDEVTRLLQGYIENESDMNPDQSCWHNCPAYQNAIYYSCYKDKFCKQQPSCGGRIIGCNNIDSKISVCRAGKNSKRRYEWIKYKNGKVLGSDNGCTRGTTEVDSWRVWFILWPCNYCMCLCDESGPDSDRYFSLKDSTSDVNSNKVVTGLRLVKLERVFHLQISEGTLGERGSITPAGWVPLTAVDLLDRNTHDGVDYHTLTYERRSIDLNEVDSPTGYVLTGVRFGKSGDRLQLEIRSTPFNYTTGQLSRSGSQWITTDQWVYDTDSRTRLELIEPDIPTRSAASLTVYSTPDKYVEFTHSDFDADAAQSTVPFIDVQPLEPLKGSALLSGAGLVHRGARLSGGFVAAKLLTYDYSRHIVVPKFTTPDTHKYSKHSIGTHS